MGAGQDNRDSSAHKAKYLRCILCAKGYVAQQPDAGDDTPFPEEWSEACNSVLASGTEPEPQVKQWLTFGKDFQEEDDSKLQQLNDYLLKRTVLGGPGTSISLVDIVVFVGVRDAVVKLVATNEYNYQNLVRWFDYVQNDLDISKLLPTVHINKPVVELEAFQNFMQDSQKAIQNIATASETTNNGNEKTASVLIKPDLESKEEAKNMNSVHEKNDDLGKKVKEKKDKGEKSISAKKEVEASVSALDIRVGLVKKCWKHPSADSLLVEEIDLGQDGVRQVVSGLAKFVKEEEMLNRKVVLIANVKPGKLRDVLSAGLVLCASNSDHSVVEPLIPPDAATVGERITFAGHEGKAEDVLNPKKKQLEKISPDLFTDDNGIATYQCIPFMTSAGPCKSSLAKAAIK